LSSTQLRDQLVQRLAKLGVEHRPLPGRDDGFASLCYAGKTFAHFHNDNEIDIKLTRSLIEREGLVHPPDSKVHPDRSRSSHWIEVRFTAAKQVDRVVELVKLAIEQL
jgi:luciferase-like monooxygenase